MNLENLRSKIDVTDKQLIMLISRRMKLVSKIGVFKKDKGDKILDLKREEEVLNSVKKTANRTGININMVLKIWKILIKEAKKNQNE